MVALRGFAFPAFRTVALVGAMAAGLAACNSMTRTASVNENAFLPPTPLDVTAQINATDARLATNALLAALTANTLEERRWRNDATGHEGMITTVRTFRTVNNTRCVEYRDFMQVRPGQSAIAVNTACLVGNDWMIMTDDGNWKRIA